MEKSREPNKNNTCFQSLTFWKLVLHLGLEDLPLSPWRGHGVWSPQALPSLFLQSVPCTPCSWRLDSPVGSPLSSAPSHSDSATVLPVSFALSHVILLCGAKFLSKPHALEPMVDVKALTIVYVPPVLHVSLHGCVCQVEVRSSGTRRKLPLTLISRGYIPSRLFTSSLTVS